ncbi:MAG: HAD-IA family hydrolase [Betaproteobacteria bacterium]|nr:HAD-IA family hydrolase [Betaproteobacteria bacterium]
MAKRFDLLVFDWDGTLMDSAAHIAAALQGAFRDLALPVPSNAAARHVIGLGLRDAMTYLNPGLDRNRYEEVADRYRVHFLAGDQDVELFPAVAAGIPALNLEGYLMAVATGKSRRGLDRSLRATGLTPYFHASRCADEGFPKPHPEMLQAVMEILGTAPDRTLMIGDTTHDLEMAKNAGVAAVAVSYGAHMLSDLEGMKPLGCVGSFEQLMQWLKQNG